MKILWITNILFSHHRTMMGLDPNVVTGGTWLNAAYEASLNDPSVELHIVTIGNTSQPLCEQKDGHYFHILSGGSRIQYDIYSEEHLSEWESLKKSVNPDAMIVWGTETRFAYVAMKAMKGIPTAIYMQGVIESIYKHYFEGVPLKYQTMTLRDVIDRINPNAPYNNFKRQTLLEREMFEMANGVIVENDWCEDMCRNINPDLTVFHNNLPIRYSFYERTWCIDSVEPLSIFVNAGGYPIKGHHILFQALGIIKKRFSEFKCYVPGEPLSTFSSVKRSTGYMVYLNKLLQDNNLKNNVIFTGRLTTQQMADKIATCSIYIMPSIVENHSSSLIEAMIVGAPVISSLVGGTASLVEHGRNGLLYNSLDADSLAGNITRLFENPELAKKLASEAIKIRQNRSGNFGEEMKHIYSLLTR